MGLGWAIGFIVIGLFLLFAEIFIPSGGILFVLSMFLIGFGIVLIFWAPESQGGGTTSGLIALSAVFVLIPAVVAAGFYYWPRTPFGKRFFLQAPQEEEATMASMPEYLELEQLRGQIGKTVTPLRPSGATLIQGHRVDTKTEGIFVDVGQWVRVVDVRAGQVTVRPLDEDELQQLPDFTA
jgi:membrane-bound ClpP family serine protease